MAIMAWLLLESTMTPALPPTVTVPPPPVENDPFWVGWRTMIPLFTVESCPRATAQAPTGAACREPSAVLKERCWEQEILTSQWPFTPTKSPLVGGMWTSTDTPL